MANEHDHHDHSGHHHGPTVLTSINRALIIGAVLNTVYVVVEFGLGFYYNSLALTADAGHNLSDVASLLLSLLAFRLARVRQTPGFTYGYRKSTVLASLTNAVVLLITIGAILWESIHRFRQPEPVAGGAVAWVAGFGILVNAGSALLFFRNKEHDLNAKGAYLHLATDALVSLGVVIAGILIAYTGWLWLDPVIGILVAIVIMGSTWRLLTDSLRLSMDGVPVDVDLADVLAELRAVTGVQDVHHVHVWAMSTTENALTAHLVLKPGLTDEQIATLKHDARHRLEHQKISHATLETETVASDDCETEIC
ncbi:MULTISPECIES: cation diffusion facilitator family transporter [unclassified Spirosoma]|uniref:cation diffusion facilitator family transporter n=1 Tax=unclassified Spirosoma TaxID=2621999 RepID=UPI00096420E0|nr:MULTISPECIES: cation diffusion facilitator family transporter [unclassified Spirosoma]MBN8822225.1 cation transporter [Spirosoma sp.]OJW72457.1 MAG: cation transporter [Spirosoma sp. 48-14]